MMNIFQRFFHVFPSRRWLKEGACSTRYPMIMVHGIGFRDDMLLPSWGGVPGCIKERQGKVFLSKVEAWGSYQDNAEILKARIEEVLTDTGAGKVNIIAHSKGGVDARYAITKLGMADKVASLTTVSTPHRGTTPADILTGLIPDEDNVLYKLADLFGKLMGDKSPDTAKAVKELTREHMKHFNEEVPDVPGVYYQSYGSHMLSPLNDPFFTIGYEILKKHEGPNDGIVSEASYRWGDFQGVVTGKIKGIGISHLQITGAVGSFYSGVDIPMLYASWINRLKEKGF